MPAQVTLVSLYGNKNEGFAAVVGELQELVSQVVPAFAPYDIRQVHATIIGLERDRAPALNANFLRFRGQERRMDFTGFLAFLRECSKLPFKLQIGGFANGDNPFTSRNLRPFERTFSVQGDKVVLMGWPVICDASVPALEGAVTPSPQYPSTLEFIRRAAQRFGILHAFHRIVTEVDNDLYFRIGLINAKAANPEAIRALETQARQLLSTRPPLFVEIGLDDIFVAAYEDDRLPTSTTRVRSVADPKVTGDFVAGLFG